MSSATVRIGSTALSCAFSSLRAPCSTTYSYLVLTHQNDLLRCMYMSASDVLVIPDRSKSLIERDKETVLALVSLENSYDTNKRYIEYIEKLPKKVSYVEGDEE